MRGFTGKLGGFMQHNFFRPFLKVFGGWEHDYAHPVYLPSSDSTHGQENDLSQVLTAKWQRTELRHLYYFLKIFVLKVWTVHFVRFIRGKRLVLCQSIFVCGWAYSTQLVHYQSVSYQDHYIRIPLNTILSILIKEENIIICIYILYQDLISYFQCVCSCVNDSYTVCQGHGDICQTNLD